MTEHYYDENGCTPDCPIRLLREQSGYSKSNASDYNWQDSENDNPTHITRNIKSGVHYGDEGGASRYFTQLAPDNEVA